MNLAGVCVGDDYWLKFRFYLGVNHWLEFILTNVSVVIIVIVIVFDSS